MRINAQKQHIFLAFFDLGIGGIQRKMVDIVNYIHQSAKYNHIVVHIILRRRRKFNFKKYFNHKFSNIHYEPRLPKIPQKITYLAFLTYLALKYRPSVMLPFLHQASSYAILVKKLLFWQRIKVVIGQDNILSFDSVQPYAAKRHSKHLIQLTYKLADGVITQTQYAKKDLVTNFKSASHKIKVIPNWTVNTQTINARKIYDIIYCGRFSQQKNLVKLLQVIKLVKKSIPNVKLCLIGEGNQESELRLFIAEKKLYSNVIIKPSSHSIIKELSRAKIFSLTSDFEGHPIILLEAMAAKVVPVVLQYPGVSEYLQHATNGFIETNQVSMAKRIIQLLKDKKSLEKIGSAGRNTVIEKNSAQLIDKTLSFILDT